MWCMFYMYGTSQLRPGSFQVCAVHTRLVVVLRTLWSLDGSSMKAGFTDEFQTPNAVLAWGTCSINICPIGDAIPISRLRQTCPEGEPHPCQLSHMFA